MHVTKDFKSVLIKTYKLSDLLKHSVLFVGIVSQVYLSYNDFKHFY